MRTTRGRIAVLLVGSSLSTGGWGAVLPFIYTDIATTRHLGGFVAAATFVAFAVGSLLASPLAGRAADHRNPVTVAALSRLAVAVAVLTVGLTSSAPAVLTTAALLGATVAYTQPATSVVLLALAPSARHRDVFAWQFIVMNLTLALGGVLGGTVVDLRTPAGTHPIYYIASAAAAVSAIAVWLTARNSHCAVIHDSETVRAGAGVRAVLRDRNLRLLLTVTVFITLACYAQYESGLPALALGALHVSAKVIGVAVALNALLVAVLTAPVITITRKLSPTTLLLTCAAIWLGCWLVIATPLLTHTHAAVSVVLAFAFISLGETMFAPVLSPLSASLAPAGALGRTLATVTGATTVANALGPALSGLLLALHAPAAFIALQVTCCLGAMVLTRKLSRHITPTTATQEVLALAP